MFICILEHEKRYRQVQTLFNHSLQMLGYYFKEDFRAILMLSARKIKSVPNYNTSVKHCSLNAIMHPLFQNYMVWLRECTLGLFCHTSFYMVDLGFVHQTRYMTPRHIYHFQQFWDKKLVNGVDFKMLVRDLTPKNVNINDN